MAAAGNVGSAGPACLASADGEDAITTNAAGARATAPTCPPPPAPAAEAPPPAMRYKLGPIHSDAEYGHQPGEINYWLPITALTPHATLWAETEPTKADFAPFLPRVRAELLLAALQHPGFLPGTKH